MTTFSGIDMAHILQTEKALDFFLNVTIPAAIKRNDVIPHTLIVCDYPRLAKAIESYIVSHLPSNLLSLYTTSSVAPGEIAATLTSLSDKAILFLGNGAFLSRIPSSAVDVFQSALKNGYLKIITGRGTSSTTHYLDLPQFSFITIIENVNRLPQKLRHSFPNIVTVSSCSNQDLCTIEIIASASENHMHFAPDAVPEIVCAANGNYRTAIRLVHWIRDYMTVQGDSFIVIPKDYVIKVVSLI